MLGVWGAYVTLVFSSDIRDGVLGKVWRVSGNIEHKVNSFVATKYKKFHDNIHYLLFHYS